MVKDSASKIPLIDQNNIKTVRYPNVSFSIELKHVDQTTRRLNMHLIESVGIINHPTNMLISIHRLEGNVGKNSTANPKQVWFI